MNPWKAIGWIVLAILLLSLTFCGMVCVRVANNVDSPEQTNSRKQTQPEQEPTTLRITEFQCTRTKGGMSVVEGYAVNDGPTELRYTELKATLTDKQGTLVGYASGHLELAPIPVGEKSAFKLLGPDAAYHGCQITSATSSGRNVLLTAD